MTAFASDARVATRFNMACRHLVFPACEGASETKRRYGACRQLLRLCNQFFTKRP
jgi:hypothetical protein